MSNVSGQPWRDVRRSPEERAALAVAAMTEDEKFPWLSAPMALPVPGRSGVPQGALGSAAYYPAIDRLGIPAIQQADASLGVGNIGDVRPGDNATALPSSLLLGATFDPQTARESGEMVGRQARAKGFAVQLAGGANLVREATGGRNFEYISEDPLLTGVLAGAAIAGIQSQGVVSTVKHFALNGQETGRVMADSRLSEPAMRESDLLAFQIAIETGQPGAVMTGYNLVNGQYASENTRLLHDILKGEWRFDGWVMSDWGATHSTADAVLAGLDVQSGANLDPQPFLGALLRQAVREGRIPRDRIDDMVHRQLRVLFRLGIVDNPPAPGGAVDYSADNLIAQRAAERGLVLLKNDGELLPAARGLNRILVIGEHADTGVLSGGGSSSVTPIGSLSTDGAAVMGVPMSKVYHPSSPLLAIRAEAQAACVDFLDGSDHEAALAAARDADLVIIIADEWRSEGLDAHGLELPDDQPQLIEAVASANPRTVVVLESGGPVDTSWAAHVPAVLAAFYPGSGGGPAIAGVLFGRVNPSGRLPITFPQSVAQTPRPRQVDPTTTTSNPGEALVGEIFKVSYDIEGSDVGYRWFDRQKLQPAFPFGWGLSYTTFNASDLAVTASGIDVRVDVTVTNTGDRAGAHVVQVYVSRNEGDGPADFVARLAAFTRLHLEPGERRSVKMNLEPRLLARWDDDLGAFRIAGGDYLVRVGDHALDTSGPAAITLVQPNVVC